MLIEGLAPRQLTPITRRIVAENEGVDTTAEIRRLLPALTRARILHDGVTADLASISERIYAVLSELRPLRLSSGPNRSAKQVANQRVVVTRLAASRRTAAWESLGSSDAVLPNASAACCG